MSTVLLLNYKNYYDRKYKYLTSVAAYKAAAPGYFEQTAVNFDPADGVTTTQVINFGASDTRQPFNYCVVYNADTSAIESRWFVMEDVFTRKNQSKLSLRRDVLADYASAYSGQDFFCERGMVANAQDILRFNNEDQHFNQILQSRQALTPSGISGRYIVGYVDKTWNGGKIFSSAVSGTYDNWESTPFADYYSGTKRMLTSGEKQNYLHLFAVNAVQPTDLNNPARGTGWYMKLNCGNSTYITNRSGGKYSLIGKNGYNDALHVEVVEALAANSGIQEQVTNAANISIKTIYDDYNSVIADWNGKLVNVGGKIYQMGISSLTETFRIDSKQYCPNLGYAVWSLMYNVDTGIWQNAAATFLSSLLDISVYATSEVTSFVFTATEVSAICTIGNRPVSELPYDIFYIPDGNVGRQFAGYMASQFAGGNVLYDIQLVPFKPTSSGISSRITIGESETTLTWASSDSVEGTFTHSAISYGTPLDWKTGSVCDMCRIVAPNGSSSWEFNPATIGGVASNSIRYEVTFMPYKPYIHIFPAFGGIYGTVNKTAGSTVGESRGFICQCDWSIPYSTSNWSTYQLQNSAYQLSHDRQIENMSINQKLGVAADVVSGIGSIGAGYMFGNAAGAVAGAAQAVGNLATGAIARKENMSYAEDMFNISLRNIQAQAQPLAQNNGITVGNSTFPTLEYYSASDEEKTILANRLRVNGWAINKISTFATEYAKLVLGVSEFIKGRLIQSAVNDDFHVAAAIAEELEKGVRL